MSNQAAPALTAGPKIEIGIDRLLIGASLLLCAIPFVIDNPYWQGLFVTAACYVIVVSGLNIVTGYCGQISLGHAGLFGFGAYAAAILSADAGWPFWLTIPAATILTCVAGLALGIPALRVSGPYLALVTIAFNFLVVKVILAGGAFTGAASGKWGVEQPFQPLSGAPDYASYFAFVLVFVALTVWVCRNLAASKWGRAWNCIRNDELVAQVSGIDLFATKLLAFVISAFFAGLGGALWAHYQGQTNYESFGLGESLTLLLMLLVGGQRTLLGPVVGAIIMVAIPVALSELDELRLLIYGVALIVLVVAFPDGVMGALMRAFRRPAGMDSALSATGRLNHVSDHDKPLRVTAVSKRFAGVTAAEEVDIEIRPGEVHALIGPNGAGKTTLVNLVTGVLPIDSGQITFVGQRVDQLPAHAVARLGVARIFQNVRLVADASVLDNVLIGGHARFRARFLETAFGMPRQTREEAQAVDKAMGLLALIGLAHKADQPAAALSYGHQHAVEIARALMSDPLVLFLDEPAAGLNAEEIDHLSRVIRTIKANGVSVFLIEHAVEFVMAIADRVTVIDFGVKIAEGAPDIVRTDPRVVEAYLGKTMEGAL